MIEKKVLTKKSKQFPSTKSNHREISSLSTYLCSNHAHIHLRMVQCIYNVHIMFYCLFKTNRLKKGRKSQALIVNKSSEVARNRVYSVWHIYFYKNVVAINGHRLELQKKKKTKQKSNAEIKLKYFFSSSYISAYQYFTKTLQIVTQII